MNEYRVARFYGSLCTLHASIHPCIRVTMKLCTCLSLWPVCPSVRLSIRLSVCLSVGLWEQEHSKVADKFSRIFTRNRNRLNFRVMCIRFRIMGLTGIFAVNPCNVSNFELLLT